MNQLCKVCGEPAAGFHFGAFTCEGCKSFFGRTYNNISAISGCKNNGDCIINKKNRTACKACRLRKCLLVGMSKSGSRYGRRSNWFKIHCLLQEQQSQHNHQSQSPGINSSPINTSSFDQFNFTHLQLQAKQTYQDKTNPSIKTANIQNSTAVLVNPFTSVQQLIKNKTKSTKQESTKSSENSNNSRHNGDCSSPYDSGASSADPEEEIFNSNSNHKNNKNLIIKMDQDLIHNSSTESLKLLPFNGHHLQHQRNPFVAAFQHMHIPSLLPIVNRNSIVNIQDEPIDLSTKSITQKQCRTTPSPEIIKNLELTTTTTSTTKPAPLDLTMSG